MDHLIGLKENVLIGKLIPAGTGMKRYRSVKLDTDEVIADDEILLSDDEDDENLILSEDDGDSLDEASEVFEIDDTEIEE